MPLIYRGPSNTLEIAGRVVKRGESVGQLSKANRELLEKRGHRFTESAESEKPSAEPKASPAPLAGEPSS